MLLFLNYFTIMPGRIFGQTSKFSPYNDLNDYLLQMFHEKPPQYKYCRAFLLAHRFWCSFFIFLHYFQCKVLYLQKSKSVWNSYTIPSASNCP